MLVVIDTNVLVSALLSKDSAPAKILGLVLNGLFTPCHDHRIMAEYRNVLRRPKFGLPTWAVTDLLEFIAESGLSVAPPPLAPSSADEADQKFYEVARFCQAWLITGNLKHFPKDELVMTVREALDRISA
jgi:putative PIN family toxin of toxin-antitoxin system